MSQLACPSNEKLFARLEEYRAHLSWNEDERALSVARVLEQLVVLPSHVVSVKHVESHIEGLEPWLANKVEDILSDIRLKRLQRVNPTPEPPLKVRKVEYVPGSTSWFAVVSCYFCSPSFTEADLEATLTQTVAKSFITPVKCTVAQEVQALVANGILVKDENEYFSLSAIGRNIAGCLVAQCPASLKFVAASELPAFVQESMLVARF
mmetsp:Transcript_24612/g.43461  ORF Transcript_24612/g.43461 Transcript_24612/m.43461 type:complete len:208 (-) Transcript_24612:15-638(-)